MLVNAISINSSEFEAILDILNDPEQLYSEFGIRSLSVKD